MQDNYIRAEEIAKQLGISKSRAYKIIRDLNSDLHKQGFITLAGRVSRAYFNEKWYGGTNG